MAPPLIEHTAN